MKEAVKKAIYSVIQSETKYLIHLKIKILNIDEMLHFVQNDTF